MQTVNDAILLIDVVWCDLLHDSPGGKIGSRRYISSNLLWSLRCDDEDDDDEVDDAEGDDAEGDDAEDDDDEGDDDEGDDDEGDDDEDDDEDDQLILIGLN